MYPDAPNPEDRAHLTIQAQAFLLDYLHHVLVDDTPEEDETEEDAEVIPTVTVDQDTADALKDVLRERGIDLGDQL